MRKFLKLFLTLTSVITCTSVISCSFFNNPKIFNGLITDKVPAEINKKYELVTFQNESKEYSNLNKKNIKIYSSIKGGIPYINMNDFFNKFSDVFNISNIRLWKMNEYEYFYIFDNKFKIIFNSKNNTISFYDENVFSIMKSPTNLDLNEHLSYVGFKPINKDTQHARVFDFGKYNIQFYNIDNNTYIPLSIFNLLFFSKNYFNVFYNGKNLYGVDFLPMGEKYFKKLSINKSDVIDDKYSAEFNKNFFLFVFDNFYGLKNKRQMNNGTEKFLIKKDWLKRLQSTDIKIRFDFYNEFVFGHLNELHSSVLNRSMLFGYESKIIANQSLSSKRNESNIIKQQLINKAPYLKEKNKDFYIENNTVFIPIQSFDVGRKNDKLNAAQNDTYWKMYKIMDKIKKIKQPIKNIVIDLSLNGGGQLHAMQKLSGFIGKHKKIIASVDKFNNQGFVMEYLTDTNDDNRYNSLDGYDEYNWFILTGINTFSAANLFTHVAKQNNAKIIGNKTGGGMFSTIPIMLPDGTGLVISSNFGFTGVAKTPVKNIDELEWIEDGIDVDINISYDDYYNFKEIDKLINKQ
ncbi:S41 family peptidase [Mycoplasma phocoenae]|uniref:Tail specific protease domain-containing protein n=1 Tax=Mycoplasma phocoenae TaxID=754517 RepID=A0A858U3N5_9MOLU|nr:S41 family peptidase [Mycoplasma phocoenae]QJG67032.1 hypothetical protein HGG69_01720 [Mycoplasma phocoenae]